MAVVAQWTYFSQEQCNSVRVLITYEGFIISYVLLQSGQFSDKFPVEAYSLDIFLTDITLRQHILTLFEIIFFTLPLTYFQITFICH